jgi:IS30 family transposase
MPRKKLPPITDQQWIEAVDAYELGHLSQREIARNLGVSPATVCRQMKRRAAVKACRIGEFIDDLNARLNREALLRIRAEAAAYDAKVRPVLERNAMIARLMEAILVAAELGNVTMANDMIAETRTQASSR